MGRLQANYNISKNNKISIKKQNLGGGRLLARSFLPNDLNGLSLWLRADAGVTYDGSNNVSSWADQSGNDRNAFVYTGTPTLTTISGKKFIVFDGSSAMTGSNVITSTPCTIISVLQWTAENGINVWFQQWDGDTGDNIALYTADSLAGFGWRGYNGVNLDSTDDTWPLDETILATTIFNQGDSKHFRNESAFGTGDTGSITPFGDYFLGIWRGSNAPMYFKIAEVIVYDRAISSQERQQVESYLNTKYNIY